MNLSANFTLEELVASESARLYGIDNSPSDEAVKNLTKLAQEVLQPVRESFGQPIIVNSAYRCPELNERVKGAKNSDHKFGAAADIRTQSGKAIDNKKLFDCIVNLANLGKIHCRQIIDEYGYKWVHVSVNHSANAQKNNQIIHLK